MTGTCFLVVFHLNKSSNKYFIMICRPRKTLSLETTNFNLLVQQTLARAIYFSFHNQFQILGNIIEGRKNLFSEGLIIIAIIRIVIMH